ncbi:MAG: S-adenosylmethionine:tRNA ribosyltransferase-isomerase [Bacteroidales bacterium]|jgi:S-adenosylmethionine:tRNA ribosyltransferase-isomerase|nr:S-adenosylmethionine:tRNA ribosyltransferase-isomerase [Bacteroidales bacterium]
MLEPKTIKIEDYNYNLPDNRIAKYPTNNRDQSKLLIYKKSNISDDSFTNILSYLPQKSTLVFNNTKVIQARLLFEKITGAKIEIFCLEPITPSDYALAFQEKRKNIWKCIVGNSKKWKSGKLVKSITINNQNIEISAKRIEKYDESQLIEFSWNDNNISFGELLDAIGKTPIPPYLNRESEDIDTKRYQTVYSKHKGSVAAPTAGLHFTDKIINNLRNNDINIEEITLHVGAGTFKPVKSETIDQHEMHTEHFIITKNTIKSLIKNIDNIISVGTTAVRTLESMHWIGVKIITNKNLATNEISISQWESYQLNQEIGVKEALNAIIDYLEKNEFERLITSTQIMIYPGYKFKVISGMITNFHQPKSTLLLLIAAFIGEDWKKVYKHAMDNDFRFLSYGDSSILLR